MLDEEELKKGLFIDLFINELTCFSLFGTAFDILLKAILLVFANKQDMEGAMSPTDIAKELGLATLR